MIQENLSNIEVEEAIKQVRGGQLDAAFYTAAVGTPLLKNISAQNGSMLKLLSFDRRFFRNQEQYFRENQQLFQDNTLGYVPAKIPANSYPWQQKEVNAISTSSFLYVNKLLGTQKVYNIAKAAYAKAPELKAQNQFWKLFSTTEAKKQISAKLDYHPGVKKLIEQQQTRK